MPPPEVHVFEHRLIARGPDEIRGQLGSFAFIYTKYCDPEGNHWFVQPGHVGHENMTNTPEMLQALFGPDAQRVFEQVVTIGEVYVQDEHGYHIPTGQEQEVWDWHTIRRLAKRENLFGRAGILCGREVLMLWGDPPGWETMLIHVVKYFCVGPNSKTVVVVGNDRQYSAKGFSSPIGRGQN